MTEPSNTHHEGSGYVQSDNVSDPYQRDIQRAADEWFRIQNHGVMARTECEVCGGSIPESHAFSWKFAAAGGCLAGPFCSPECYWRWMF